MKNFISKIVRSKYSLLYLLLFIALLYALQEKAIMPLVMKVVESELFFEKPIEENEPLGKMTGKTPRTGYALIQCQDAVKQKGDLPDNAEFLDDKFEAWALGNRQYLIRSSIRFIDPEKGQMEKPYACTVRMTGEDESNSESWTILGLDLNAVGNN